MHPPYLIKKKNTHFYTTPVLQANKGAQGRRGGEKAKGGREETKGGRGGRVDRPLPRGPDPSGLQLVSGSHSHRQEEQAAHIQRGSLVIFPLSNFMHHVSPAMK
jgi:hypothetical protein